MTINCFKVLVLLQVEDTLLYVRTIRVGILVLELLLITTYMSEKTVARKKNCLQNKKFLRTVTTAHYTSTLAFITTCWKRAVSVDLKKQV